MRVSSVATSTVFYGPGGCGGMRGLLALVLVVAFLPVTSAQTTTALEASDAAGDVLVHGEAAPPSGPVDILGLTVTEETGLLVVRLDVADAPSDIAHYQV